MFPNKTLPKKLKQEGLLHAKTIGMICEVISRLANDVFLSSTAIKQTRHIPFFPHTYIIGHYNTNLYHVKAVLTWHTESRLTFLSNFLRIWYISIISKEGNIMYVNRSNYVTGISLPVTGTEGVSHVGVSYAL